MKTLSTRLANEPPSLQLESEIARVVVPGSYAHFGGSMRLADGALCRIPNYTTDFDAALAVFRERLPGWQITLSLELPHARNAKPGWYCDLDEPDDDLTLHPSHWRKAEGFHASEPQMALLSAVAQAEGW